MFKFLIYGVALMLSIMSLIYLTIFAIVPAAFVMLFISKELEV